MLKVVARNFQSNESILDSSNRSPLKMEKKFSCSPKKRDARYWDLLDEYISASNILSEKTDAEIKAYKEYLEASERVRKISEELKSLEKHIVKI